MAQSARHNSAGAHRASPTYPRPQPPGLTPTLERNTQTLENRRKQDEAAGTREERIAQAITDFTGSMRFVYLHLVLFGFWILANLGWIPGVPAWDPSFVVLAMIASVEAIFLSTFVLISQNRISAGADKRADLHLQVGLLAEHEITKVAELIAAVATHLGVNTVDGRELAEIQQDVAAEAVLEAIEATKA